MVLSSALTLSADERKLVPSWMILYLRTRLKSNAQNALTPIPLRLNTFMKTNGRKMDGKCVVRHARKPIKRSISAIQIYKSIINLTEKPTNNFQRRKRKEDRTEKNIVPALEYRNMNKHIRKPIINDLKSRNRGAYI